MSDDDAGPTWAMKTPPMDLVIERIDERIRALGLSDRQASLRATGYPDAIREIRRGKRPSSQRFVQLAAALETTPDYISGYVDHEKQAMWRATTSSALPIEGVQEMPRNIPVYGMSANGDIGMMDFERVKGIEVLKYDLDRPIDYCRRPPRLALRDDIIAISTFGSAMYPRYEDAEILYLEPTHGADGDYALVVLESDVPDRTGQAGPWMMLKRIAHRDWLHGNSTFEQFNPQRRFEVPREKVAKIYKVLSQNQLLSL